MAIAIGSAKAVLTNRLVRGGIMVGAALVIVFLLPRPDGVDPRGWRLLAIFVATILGLILQPLPMGAVVVLGIAVAALSRAVTAPVAFSAFANPVVWLIVVAFLLARATVLTGLGRRTAFLLVRGFGSSSLRLAYALAGADLLVAPFVPSDTARVGSIIFPVARSVAEGYGSHPGPTARRLGAYLMQSVYHVGCTTSAIFLTSMAANPLAAELAHKVAGVEITWLTWVLASAVPGAVSLGTLPWLIYRLSPPELRLTPEARRTAQEELRGLGPMTRGERKLIVILLAVIAGWVTQPWHRLHPAVVALGGLSLLLLTGVMRWDAVLEERRAWDAFIWFGGLIMLAEGLLSFGLIRKFADWFSTHLQGWNWLPALVAVIVAYTYVHYGFASMTAHISALYPAFLMLAMANGAPALVAALALAYFSNLNASLTHYGTGPAPILFGAGYVSQVTWWRVGFVVVLLQFVIWLALGLAWWRLLGLC